VTVSTPKRRCAAARIHAGVSRAPGSVDRAQLLHDDAELQLLGGGQDPAQDLRGIGVLQGVEHHAHHLVGGRATRSGGGLVAVLAQRGLDAPAGGLGHVGPVVEYL
jgi:hypothetical protein